MADITYGSSGAGCGLAVLSDVEAISGYERVNLNAWLKRGGAVVAVAVLSGEEKQRLTALRSAGFRLLKKFKSRSGNYNLGLYVKASKPYKRKAKKKSR